jgi:uncharacterized protein YjeT (DUF2065 family)
VTVVLLAIGLVLVVEGLALALAPARMEQVMAAIAAMSRDRRRLIGLAMLAAGVLLVWLGRGAAA